MQPFKRYLWWSQFGLCGLLLVCCLLLPSVAIRNGGVSNFGNHVRTIVPYILSFSVSIVCLGLAARELQRLSHHFWRKSGLLLMLAFLELLVLVSTFPRHISWTYSVIHDDIGIALFAYEFLLSVWLVYKNYSSQAMLLISLESAGSLIGLLSIVKVIHFLFIGQMVGALGFGLLLLTTLPARIAADYEAEPTKA